MYSININTGKIFLTADNTEVLPKTVNYTNYITWLSQDNSPTETDYKPTSDLISKSQYKTIIEHIYSHLYIRALSSSMNKRNYNIKFLTAQREEYQDKYDVATGKITSGTRYDNTLGLIQGEMDDEFSELVLDTLLPTLGITPTGTHLNKMFQLIIVKFEYGRNAFDSFMKFVRRFRTKCFKWLDDGSWDKIDSAIDIVENMPDSLTLSEAQALYNQFNNI